jgi:hypothetical protein
MAVTFLQVVNDTLKRVRVIQGDAGELATSTVTSTATGLVATGAFTDSGRQTEIDLAIQLWQEAVHEVYGMGLFPNEGSSATFTLATGQREYSFPSDFERVAGANYHDRVLRGATSGLLAFEYKSGYAGMLRDQVLATDFTGDPSFWAISPVDGSLRLDREPTTEQAGDTWNMLYEKQLVLTSTMATDTLPFADTVSAAIVPVVAEAWNRVFKKEFDQGMFRSSLARSLDYMARTQRRNRYGKR